MYLTDLADVLRRAGLDVVEIPGWKTRGRPGTFAPIGILCHHTAGAADGLAYATWMAMVGRDDLPAPLAQLGLNRKGTYFVQAAGRANHAGKCKPIAGLKALSGRDYGDGNAQLVGIEAMNTGSEGWTTAQYDAYVRGCAAINAAYGFPASRTLAHRETSLSGKPDPGGIDMPKFRTQVASVDLGTPSPEEDDMFNETDRGRLEYAANVAGPRTASILAELAALRSIVAALAAAMPGQVLTADEVAAAAKAGAQAALDERITGADVTLEVTP